MSYVTEPFQAYLAASLDATDVYLPLASAPHADLLKLLQAKDSYTVLSIKDDTNFETVRVEASGGYLLLTRGLSGTTPTKFSFGSCVSTISPTVLEVLQSVGAELLGTQCDDYYHPDAMGGDLSISFTDLPKGSIGRPYIGHVVFGGSLPMTAEVENVPTWMTVVHTANMLELTGTPQASATYSINVHAHNVQENKTLDSQIHVTIA